MIEHGALDIFPGGEMKFADAGFSGNVAMLASFTPQPANRMIRSDACCWSSFRRGMPRSAVGCCPEVRMRLHPNAIISSIAFCGFLHTSKARWKVTDIPCEAFISCSINGMSTFPSAVKQPNTTPSAPRRRAFSMSFSMMRCSWRSKGSLLHGDGQ